VETHLKRFTANIIYSSLRSNFKDIGGLLEQYRRVTPIKVGIVIVAIAYFLFTLHATFVLSWIGEWEALGAYNPQAAFWIFVTDVSAYAFLLLRFLASIVAVSAAILYLSKRWLLQSTTYKLLRVILILEGLYWLGLLPSGIWGIIPSNAGFSTSLLVSTGIPCMVGSIGIPVSLFMLAYRLNPNQPPKKAIKWMLIAGFFYVLEFWLNNTGMWIITVMQDGSGILSNSPQLIASFASAVAGLLALALFTGYFAKKSIGAVDWSQLSIRISGAIITSLGLFFLWNYLTWIFWGGWNQWYAWILGHNLDLWMLTLPLVGLPMLFYRRDQGEEAAS